MMGVVIWSDPTEQKAVFWCEDHGDLAYYDGARKTELTPNPMAAGDMVQFEITLEQQTRHAHKARVVEPNVCNSLRDRLRDTPPGQETQERNDNIIPLRTASGQVGQRARKRAT